MATERRPPALLGTTLLLPERVCNSTVAYGGRFSLHERPQTQFRKAQVPVLIDHLLETVANDAASTRCLSH